ncbi:response regulator [Nitrosomonas sp. Nm58]|jgi:two-component system response regulator|uniref:response regulator n=1 Tax=Nitrosomonas sp. Nm58 TaxID=200126 RepID=UPI00089B3747|nr:response regulator [Nitrosomonas sp. Nm58]SDY35856.1 two-component system, unclassified family, response regulator [Nitrosomonas sp. Nm58]
MGNRVIMLVEDNPDDALLTIDALEANQINNKVVIARNGVEALDYLFGQKGCSQQKITDLPALILLDLKLPKINGLEVLRRIRADERIRLLPTVILTSSNEDEDRVKAYSLGTNSYVRKPVDFDDFIRMAGLIGLYWLGLNEPPYGRHQSVSVSA